MTLYRPRSRDDPAPPAVPQMTGGGRLPLVVAAALLLLVHAPVAEPYGYRRLADLARQRLSGSAGRQRLSGLGRHAAAVAENLRAASEQTDRWVHSTETGATSGYRAYTADTGRRRLIQGRDG